MNARQLLEAETPRSMFRVLHTPRIRSIRVEGRRWFQRLYGNTYHSARIFVDDELVHTIDYAYGYGNQYEQNAWEWLIKNGYVEPEGFEYPWRYCERKGIQYSASSIDVKRKSELVF